MTNLLGPKCTELAKQKLNLLGEWKCFCIGTTAMVPIDDEHFSCMCDGCNVLNGDNPPTMPSFIHEFDLHGKMFRVHMGDGDKKVVGIVDFGVLNYDE